ncbi:MAG TPA: M23 family metallopeptidase [Deinococcales bacterium]|nr:M23 family metallopeptidase [Deinococcales bacterium]
MRLPGRDVLAVLIAATLGSSFASHSVVVKPKDTLYSLARAHGTTVEALVQANGLRGEALTIGQTLVVPHAAEAKPAASRAPEGKPAATAAPAAYRAVTVAAGQTLYSLARESGTTVEILKELNGLASERLAVGQQLRLPALPAAAPMAAPAAALPASLAVESVTPAAPAPPVLAQTERPLWPLAGVLTQGYGDKHPGLDIAAPIGTPIYAAISGTVSFAGWDATGYGLRVVVNGVDGLSYSYAHASKVLVKRGDKVAQGEVIALVGSTGNSTGPHLDFRVMRSDASTLSPLAVLPASRVQLASTAGRQR